VAAPEPLAPPPPPAPLLLAAPEVSAQATVDYHRPKSAAQEWPAADPREESLERRMERLERMVERVLKMQTPPTRADDSLGHVERGSRSESESEAPTNLLRKEHRYFNPLDPETSSYEKEKDKSAKVYFKEAEEQFRTAQKELHDAFQHEDLARMQRLHVLKQKDHFAMERQILEEQRRALQRELEILERRIAEIEAKRSADQAGEDDTVLRLERRKNSESLPSN
jgi:hypothetical protein